MSDKVKLKVGNLLISNGMLTYAKDSPMAYIIRIHKNNGFNYTTLVWIQEPEKTDLWEDLDLIYHIKYGTLLIYE